MSININANLSLGAPQYLDDRQFVNTIDELLSLNLNTIPEGFEVYVKDKDCKYKYNSNYNEENTGCWKKIESSDTSSDSRELTYEEYMKLSEEERNNGTEYYIPDIDDPQISLNPVLWSTPIDGGCILSWQPVENSVKYEIQKKDNDTWVTLTQTTSMAYLDNTIENETSIEYRLLSYMPDVEEPYVIATVFGSALSGIIPVMSGATSETPGKSGLVPTPESDGYDTKYLRADGTWAVPPNTTYTRMVGSSSSANGKMGLVPAPSKYQQYCFLRADGTWTNPPNTTYDPMTGATNEAAGKQGLVPKPLAGEHDSFLKGDGTWAVPTDTTYDVMTGATSTTGGSQGLVPGPSNKLSGYNGLRVLSECGSWFHPALNLVKYESILKDESVSISANYLQHSLILISGYPGSMQLYACTSLMSSVFVSSTPIVSLGGNINEMAKVEFDTSTGGYLKITNVSTNSTPYSAEIYVYKFSKDKSILNNFS